MYSPAGRTLTTYNLIWISDEDLSYLTNFNI